MSRLWRESRLRLSYQGPNMLKNPTIFGLATKSHSPGKDFMETF